MLLGIIPTYFVYKFMITDESIFQKIFFTYCVWLIWPLAFIVVYQIKKDEIQQNEELKK